jgi:hypothetical protein
MLYFSLLILGGMITVAGAAMIAFGISNNAFDLGNTLIIAGTVAIVGGLMLIGIAHAVKYLKRISDNMALNPAALPQLSGIAEPVAPSISREPAAPARVPFPSRPEPRNRAPAAITPEPRVDMASLDAALDHPAGPPDFVRAPGARVGLQPEPPLAPESKLAAKRSTDEELSDAILASAFRLDPPSKPEPFKRNEMSEPAWPPAPATPPEPKPQPVELPLEMRQAEPEPEHDAPEQPAESYAVSILKSGVIDGMAYTLYSDGSIEAEMPQGTMRFASIDELRDYLEQTS